MMSETGKDTHVENQIPVPFSQNKGDEEAAAHVQPGQVETDADAQPGENQPVAGVQQAGEDESIEELDDLEFLLEEIESKIAPLA